MQPEVVESAVEDRLDPKVCDRARLARDPRFDGRFFIAVLSTGIYCRPICSSPTARRENVRYYTSAEEALAAGFRPCLRCRPETAPGTPAWNGSSTTVHRALRLITEGALREESLAALSARLGVSSRHLHRLFVRHLGASPLAVARTRRLQFAKQLISDTDLPMAEVARTSGFGSVRRFNDSIRRLYRRTPSQLRRLRAATAAGRGDATDAYVFRLAYHPPYDWDSLLDFLARRAIPGVEEVVDGVYRRSFSAGGRHGIVEVRHDESRRSIEARIRFADPLALLPLVSRLRDVFDLAADPSAIAQRFGRDPLLRPLTKRWPGLRVPGAWDLFELSVRAILGQQVTVAGASTLAGRLARELGEPLSLAAAGGLSVVFPEPAVVAAAELRGMPGTRARAIRSVAREIASGRLSLARGDEAFLKGLARLEGIGEWTAQYIAMRALRHPDAFPVQDLVLLRAAGDGSPLSPARLRERAEAWRPWRAYAAMYLWRAAAEDGRRALPRLDAAKSFHPREPHPRGTARQPPTPPPATERRAVRT